MLFRYKKKQKSAPCDISQKNADKDKARSHLNSSVHLGTSELINELHLGNSRTTAKLGNSFIFTGKPTNQKKLFNSNAVKAN